MSAERTSVIHDLGEEEWDYLIVLDACRYDYLSSMYRRYLEGALLARLSPGIDTPSWCRKALRRVFKDTIYISANPYINSTVPVKGCIVQGRFRKIVDVWRDGWDERLGTVPPWITTQSALEHLAEAERMIVHYLQPHAPYLSPNYLVTGFPTPRPGRASILRWTRDRGEPPITEKTLRLAASMLWRAGLIAHPWPLLEALRLPPASPMDMVRRLYGIKGLREAYRENLDMVLGYVALLVNKILKHRPDARIVVTADHGEVLGENGQYGHSFEHPYVRLVPWLRVTGVKRIPGDAEIRVKLYRLRSRLKHG